MNGILVRMRYFASEWIRIFNFFYYGFSHNDPRQDCADPSFFRDSYTRTVRIHEKERCSRIFLLLKSSLEDILSAKYWSTMPLKRHPIVNYKWMFPKFDTSFFRKFEDTSALHETYSTGPYLKQVTDYKRNDITDIYRYFLKRYEYHYHRQTFSSKTRK